MTENYDEITLESSIHVARCPSSSPHPDILMLSGANTILLFAIKKGNLDIVKFSPEHDALLESKGEPDMTALGLAVTYSKSNIVQFLLEVRG